MIGVGSAECEVRSAELGVGSLNIFNYFYNSEKNLNY